MSTFSDLHSFWRMGGYASAVWAAYGLTFLILLIQFAVVKIKWRRLRKSLHQKYVKSS